jgi:hypothetical protein
MSGEALLQRMALASELVMMVKPFTRLESPH